MDTQKQIVIALDRAAGNAAYAGATPATSKQTWFLAGLIAKIGKDAAWVGCEITNHNAILTKTSASKYIDSMLSRPVAA